MKHIISFIIYAVLSGCTSAPLSVNYYLLHTPSTQPVQIKAQNALVNLDSVDLADYLRQASIVIQLSEHELHYARQDLWAEDLHIAFSKALKQDLIQTNKNNGSVAAGNIPTALTLEVDLEHFHITNNSKVLSSGSYRIKGIKKQWLDKRFYYTLPLEKDGFADAVSQLRKTIALLAKQINTDMSQLKTEQKM